MSEREWRRERDVRILQRTAVILSRCAERCLASEEKAVLRRLEQEVWRLAERLEVER
jgi:hypothetical protein